MIPYRIPSVRVILSGGDPLHLSPRRLADIVQALARIAHVRIIRVHTRLPVVAPARVTAALVRSLKAAVKATYVVLHANHARELSPNARAACARLIDAGIPMLSQTVLLRGINDDVQSLGELMRALVDKVKFVSKPEAGTAVYLEKVLEFESGSLADLQRPPPRA